MYTSKIALLFVSLFTWVSCDKSTIPADTLETRTRIVSNLAVDGCDWHFEIWNADSTNITNYVPTKASEPRVKAAVPKFGTEDAYSFIDVEIKYRITQEKRNLTCGWGKIIEVEAIEIVDIKTVE